MGNVLIDCIDGLNTRQVMHAQTSALGPETTIAQAREYFAASSSRRLAILARDGVYLGALTAADLPTGGDPTRPALEVADQHQTVTPDAPAVTARDLVLATEARRVPVVSDEGRYLGIISLNGGREWFCGTGG